MTCGRRLAFENAGRFRHPRNLGDSQWAGELARGGRGGDMARLACDRGPKTSVRRRLLGTTTLVGISLGLTAGVPAFVLLTSLATTAALADGGAGSAGFGGAGG